MKTRFIVLLALAGVVRPCQGAVDGIAYFEREIRPILVRHCYECHSTDSKVKGGLRLDSREGVEAGGDHGAILVKGDPEASRVIVAVRYQDGDLQMPPSNPLSREQVSKLEHWIAMGAPDPRISSRTNQGRLEGMSPSEGRRFWSFQPLASVGIPDRQSPFIQNSIDRFVLETLEEKQLRPASRADKTTLIRRVTQDLTGLPPTAGEITAFLSDESPNAFERVVERLLSSPHYGVRWGRHWLDVARYADSNGLDENIGFGNAWRYRDYVVQSFNDDKPYDQFLIEQLAGDLVPGANQETLTATGFLQLGPKVLAEPDVEKLQWDVIDEQLDTMGKTFLGMTFGCARCHDHKFDPIKQTDYYGLAAIFKGTRTFGGENMGAIKFWYEHSIASEEDKARLKEVDAELKNLNSAASAYKNKAVSRIRTEARANAVEYLVACTQFDSSMPLTDLARIAAPKALHPRILHHCRKHLEYHREDPFFADWHRYADEGKVEALRDHYASLFEKAEKALALARKEDAKMTSLKDEQLERARAALDDKAGFLAVPTVDADAFGEETLAEYFRLLAVARAFESTAPDAPALMGVGDGEVVDTVPLLIRGDWKRRGREVARAVPQVMRWNGEGPPFQRETSGRLELARWMVDPRHPLTARVMVNRLWGWHFGAGLVASTENFGVMGDRPSHPELLDWLARYFVQSGWSIKAMHRLILGSGTWQMASHHPKESEYQAMDPENRWLWKQNLRRLSAEQIRDSVLAVSGRLDRCLGGKTLPLRNRQFVFNHTSEDHTTYDSLRRAIYLPVIRNHLYPFFQQFDFPDPTMPTGVRQETVIAPQALVMLNDPLMLDSATALAETILGGHETFEDRLQAIYLRCLGRVPTKAEVERGGEFIGIVTARHSVRKAWALYGQGLFASNGFLYLK